MTTPTSTPTSPESPQTPAAAAAATPDGDAWGLRGKRALVTGGTKGIGAATARLLAGAGAHVVVTARTAPAQPVAGTTFLAADLASPEGPEQLAAAALEQLGGLDVLVDNAGSQTVHATSADFSDDDWARDLQVNLLSAVRLDRALLPALTASRGAVVHVSSMAARMPDAPVIAYATAKAALAAYSKALSREVGPAGVRVNTVLPGFAATEMMVGRVQAMADAAGQPYDDFADGMVTAMGVSLRRAGTPEEVGRTIAFLASPAAAYLTGVALPVDGGIQPTVF